jgi:hypothetical protein
MSQATATPLPCAACKQPVIEKRTLDGAVVVLDAATKRLHLCVKRKEVEAAKAKQIAASRAKERARPAPRPPVKRPVATAAADEARPVRPPRRDAKADSQRKAKKHRARKPTLRTPEQVTAILKGPIVRWRTGDGPTSFCDTCGAPVLAGFSHVRWDVMMVDAVGHRPHDCEASRQAAAALRAQSVARPVDVPELPVTEASRATARTLAPVEPAAPIATAQAKPRRRPAERAAAVAANSCETCGNLKASVNGQWVCLHCG